MSGLVFERVGIRPGAQRLIDLPTTVGRGQTLPLMAPGGSGKSTFLNFLRGTLDPALEAKGRVLLDGEGITDLPAELGHPGILCQDPLLFPHRSAAGNLRVALPPSRGGRAARRAKFDAARSRPGWRIWRAR
jgi:putative thiamine transport system ATP-binding protein